MLLLAECRAERAGKNNELRPQSGRRLNLPPETSTDTELAFCMPLFLLETFLKQLRESELLEILLQLRFQLIYLGAAYPQHTLTLSKTTVK